MNLSIARRQTLSQDLRKVGVAGISIGIISPLFMSQLAEVGLGSYWIPGLALALGLVAWIAWGSAHAFPLHILERFV